MDRSPQAGFTLFEILVVMMVTVIMTGLLIQNFSRTRVDLNQTVLTVTDAVRQAQSNALSGMVFAGKYRCGYGIHFEASGYFIYAGPDSASVDCSTQNRNYDGADAVVQEGLLVNNSLEITGAQDIFFEPPNPVTYINNTSAAGTFVNITIMRKGASCPSSDCRTIYVSTSGQIQAQ